MIVGFTQAEGAPIGAGVFHTDDGQDFSGYSPEHAAPFLATPPDNIAVKVPRGAPAPVDLMAPQELQKVPPVQSGPPPAEMAGTGQRMVEPEPPPPPPAPMQRAPMAPQGAPPAPTAPAQPKLVGGDPRFGGAPAGMAAKSMTRSYEGAGAPYTEEEQRARAEAMALENEAHKATAVSQISQANAAHLEAQRRAVAAQRELVKANNERENEIRSFTQRKQEVDDDVDRAMRREVNPNRYFEDKGALGTIGAALAQAIGAFGATLGHTPNFAQQIIDSAVARDVAAQRDNIERDGLRANNKLADLMRTHNMTLNEATLRLQQSQQRLADAHAYELASASKSEDTRNAFNEWLAGRERQRLDENRKFVNESLGKQSGKVEFTKAAAGGAGGLTHPILKKAFGSVQEANRAERDFYVAHPEASHGDFLSYVENVTRGKAGEQGGPGDIKVSPRLQGMLVKDETINATAAERAKQYGLERNPETGKWEVPSAIGGAWTWATSKAGQIVGTPGAAARGATRETLVDERASAAAQGKPDAETMEQYRHQESTNNPWVIAEQLNEAERAGREQKKAIVDTAKHSRMTGARERDDDDDDDRGGRR